MPEKNDNPQSLNRRLVIVSGLSGSGKSIAIRQLEDSGYYCLDNLPLAFLSPVFADLRARGFDRIAVAIDARGHQNFDTLFEQLAQLRDSGVEVRSMFLTASDAELVKRFSETRRRHPLSLRKETGFAERTLPEAIALERELLWRLEESSQVIDTTGMRPNVLRDWVRQFSDAKTSQMTLAFESFAFKHGTPVSADLVFDVRNLPNPYYDETLRGYTGLDTPIIEYFSHYPEVSEMIEDIVRFIRKWLPSYESQNRHYLTIAIGCTGGQHRSVFVAEALSRHFPDITGVVVRHRQIDQNRDSSATSPKNPVS